MNLTALAIAATAVNILDFQGRALDLTNGVANDFVPIQAFEFLNAFEQQVRLSPHFAQPHPISNTILQWILTSTQSTGASPFKITNARTGSVLSYASANTPGLTSVGNVIRQQLMAHTSASTTFDVTFVGSGFTCVSFSFFACVMGERKCAEQLVWFNV